MSKKNLQEIITILEKEKKVNVNDLSNRFELSTVSIRKYLNIIEQQGLIKRFYGGAELATPHRNDHADRELEYSVLESLAYRARQEISDNDSIFIGSGRTCCLLAKQLAGLKGLTVVTNNITALSDLNTYADRVYLIGGEVTTTDNETLFSSWVKPQVVLESIFVKKAFTSISGLDIKAGLTVDSMISTYLYKYIPTMAQRWILLADNTKYNKIAIYQVASLDAIDMIITNTLPHDYSEQFKKLNIKEVIIDK